MTPSAIRTSPNPKVCLPHAGSEVDTSQQFRNEYLFTAYYLTSLAFGRGPLTLLRRRFGFVLSALFLPTFSSVPGRLRQGVMTWQ